MATTTNFGWETPDDTDLVKDGAAAMRTLGNSIDTSFVDLKGGTSGQMLTKASNTDLDYTWVTPEIGDITAITASSPLTGGGTTGAVTVGIQDATTSVKGAVQLTDSTSSTSVTTAATPNSVKSAYDLANGAIAKSTVTTAGDIIFRNGSVPTRLGIGTAGQVLTVNSGATAPEWATASGGGGLTLLSTTTMNSGTSTQTVSGIAGGYTNLQIVLTQGRDAAGSAGWDFRLNGDTGTKYAQAWNGQYWGGTDNGVSLTTKVRIGNRTSNSTNGLKQSYLILNVYNYTNGGMTLCDWRALSHDGGAGDTYTMTQGILAYSASAAITSFSVLNDSSTWQSGTIRIYGVK
jgi:hypothetical protein